MSRGRQDGEDVLIFTENEAFLKTLEKDFQQYYNKILEAERDILNEDYTGSRIDILDEDDLSKGVFETSMETGREYVNEPEDDEDDEPEPSDELDESRQTSSPRPTDEPISSPTDLGNNSPEPSEMPEPTQSPTPTGNITTQVYF